MSARLCALGAALALLSVGCDTPPDKGVIDAASPNAGISPAPLSTAPDPSADAGVAAGGIPVERLTASAPSGSASAPTPEPLAPEKPLEADSPPSREATGVEVTASFRWRDVPPPPKAPEVNVPGIQEAAKATALVLKGQLSETGRMRMVFASRALPLPMHAELRARADRWGNIVVWPSESQYRVIPPGALRTVFGERRVDVTPLAASPVKAQGEGKKLGFSTRKMELTSALGTLKLEVAKVTEAGDGGQLFCRALVELAAIDPKTSACQPGEVAVSAVYTWQDGGGVAVEVTRLDKHSDLAAGDLLVPPSLAAFAVSGLPASDGVFLTREELAAFRTAPLTLPPVTDPSVPGEGFTAVNASDLLSYLLVDGVPAVAVPPGKEQYLLGPVRGRYIVQWRTFLGERIEPPRFVEMPARLRTGAPEAGPADAGAPDAK